MKAFLTEFKEFMAKGNVMDLAVGVIIGAAFKAIVDSLVADIISPVIGVLFQQDFSSLSITVGEAQIMYGSFIMAILNFIIIAFVLFVMIKAVNKMRTEEEAEVTTKTCPHCLSEVPLEATKCAHCTSEL